MKLHKIFLFCLCLIIFVPQVYGQAPSLAPGFPIIIDSLNGAASQPVVADIDEDGSEDIVVSKNSPPFLIFVYNLQGEVIPGWPQPVDGGTFALAAGDLDGDGHIEVVARTVYSLYAFRNNGALLAGFPQVFANDLDLGRRQIALYDFHNNNTLDIVNATFNRVAVYHNDGSVHTGWPKTLRGKMALYPSVADINNDGNAEIIIASYRIVPQSTNDSAWIHVLNINGEYLPGWPKLLDSNYAIFSSASIGNINNDDSLEILIGSHYYITLDTCYTKINIFSPTGVLLKTWFNRNSGYIEFGDIAIGDVNNDNIPEIAVSDRKNNNFLFDTDGNDVPGWPVNRYQYFPPKLVDIDNDSVPEIFLGYNASTFPEDTGRIYCYKNNAQQVAWSPLHVYGNTGVDQPLFSDLNNDGSLEMIFLGRISVHNHGGYALSVYTFANAAFTAKGSPWPQLEHDRHGTYQFGYVPSDNIVGVPAAEKSIPQFFLAQNYPNPFNPLTTIHYTLSASALVSLKVYDILGREVATLINNEPMQPGKHEKQFDGSKLSSGVYFYRLNVDGKFSATKKLVVMK
jgi:hypothetical protein